MLGLNQMKNFMYLAVFLVGLGFSNLAWGNAEISVHFGMKFGSKLNIQEITKDGLTTWVDQKNMPFHFGADALYRHMMGDTGSFGVGVRYRFAFTGEKDYEGATNIDTDKYKFTHHRIALLANYRFHMDQFFVGPVLGIDIWKSLKYSYTFNAGDGDEAFELSSNQFLWNQVGGQLGLEIGYKPTDNLLVKLEAGYDLSGFGDLKCKAGSGDTLNDCNSSNNPLKMTSTGDDSESTESFKLNAFYLTLGIGWFFG